MTYGRRIMERVAPAPRYLPLNRREPFRSRMSRWGGGKPVVFEDRPESKTLSGLGGVGDSSVVSMYSEEGVDAKSSGDKLAFRWLEYACPLLEKRPDSETTSFERIIGPSTTRLPIILCHALLRVVDPLLTGGSSCGTSARFALDAQAANFASMSLLSGAYASAGGLAKSHTHKIRCYSR